MVIYVELTKSAELQAMPSRACDQTFRKLLAKKESSINQTTPSSPEMHVSPGEKEITTERTCIRRAPVLSM
jgi:hypothetical protein